jgi:hypothetical protein
VVRPHRERFRRERKQYVEKAQTLLAKVGLAESETAFLGAFRRYAAARLALPGLDSSAANPPA